MIPENQSGQTQQEKQLTKWQQFFDVLSEMDRGQLAKLRQSLSGRPAPFLARAIYAAELESHLQDEWQRDVLGTVAGLYALIERPHDEETEEEEESRVQRKQQPLGQLLGELHVQQNRQTGRKLDAPSSIEKRFLALLDADADALPYQLRQVVTLLKAHNIKPDWARLTNDLMFWKTNGGKRIRSEWSDAFYLEPAKHIRSEKNDTDTEDDTPTEEATP